jgi:hypothetical protein
MMLSANSTTPCTTSADRQDSRAQYMLDIVRVRQILRGGSQTM